MGGAAYLHTVIFSDLVVEGGTQSHSSLPVLFSSLTMGAKQLSKHK
jgi:hypothetical protein